MSDERAIWELEEQFWTGHRPFHERTVSPGTIMCFGKPVGVVKGETAQKALDDAPDWVGVEMSERAYSRPSEDVAVTGYLASGDGGNGVLHRAYCSSTWLRRGEDWTIIQHQQTPA